MSTRPLACRANQFDCLVSSRTTRAPDVQIRLRQKSKFACAFKLIWVVQSARKKYFALHSLHSLASLSHPASSKRGVRAIVTTREAGMRWTLSRQALLRETTGEMADGEVVWSWRPKAGVKWRRAHRIAQTDGDNKVWSPGRARRTPLKPPRRECRLLRLNLWFCRVLFCCTRTMGAACTRHSLRPLLPRDMTEINLGCNRRRENEASCLLMAV